MGGNTYTEAIQKELHVPFDSAEQLKRGVSVEHVAVDDARAVLRAVTENLVLEIQKTFDFFKGTATDRIDRIVLTGGSSLIEGFREALDERFGTPVELLDPFKRIRFDARKLASDQADATHTAAVAVGLALRRSSDR